MKMSLLQRLDLYAEIEFLLDCGLSFHLCLFVCFHWLLTNETLGGIVGAVVFPVFTFIDRILFGKQP